MMKRLILSALVIGTVAVEAHAAGVKTAVVNIPSRRDANPLTATLFVPDPLPSGPVPAVAIAPGGAQDHDGIPWTGRALAQAGYVALITGPGSIERCNPEERGALVCANWQSVDAAWSGVDYLTSGAVEIDGTPVPVDAGRIGVAGYSIGSRAASYVQGAEPRVRACVAWDNLSSNLEGDTGAASGGTAASLAGRWAPIAARVPCMGQANDGSGVTNTDRSETIKTAAYRHWKRQGVPAMQLVFEGSGHGAWGGDDETSGLHPILAYYTVAWFDRFLRDDTTATARLLAKDVLGQDRSALLDDEFLSAVFLPDDGFVCDDFENDPDCN